MAEAKIRVELVDLFSTKIPALKTFNKELKILLIIEPLINFEKREKGNFLNF